MSRIASGLSVKFGKVNRLALSRLCASAVVAFYFTWNSPAVDAGQLQIAQFVGAVGCKSSSCHGGAGEKRSQYLTWAQRDFHTKAYAILTNARSARIADTLSLSSAPTSARCTICHSPFQAVAPARLTSTASSDEGVSCESCHNAAEPWLRGHTRTDWTYAMRVSAGMRDLRSFYVRANTCVACHQNIDSDILKAGHPELAFELDRQSIAEPKHWREDDPENGPRAWLVGQAVALREVSWKLSKNDTPDRELIAKWNGLGWLLGKVTTNETRLPVISLPIEMDRASFDGMKDAADLLARRAAEYSWSAGFASKLLRTLAGADSEFGPSQQTSPEILFRRAERLVLALERLSAAVDRNPSPAAKNQDLASLFEDIRSIPFQPAKFAADLAIFRTTIERSPY